jgi:hypothetical protein
VIKISALEIGGLVHIPADEPPTSPVIVGDFYRFCEVPCPSCNGMGKVGYGPAGPRSAGGLLSCPACAGSGKQSIPSWMIVRAVRRTHE